MELNIAQIMEKKNAEQLRWLVDKLAYDTAFGCWTRPGLEYIIWPAIRERARWIIFGDLDQIKIQNDNYGYEEVNRRIREAIQLRKSDVPAAGRWFSGDELVWILCDTDDRAPINPNLAAERLQNAFKRFGLSVTIGISRVLSQGDLTENVLPAARLVMRSKNHGRRGTIRQTGSLDWSFFGRGRS